MDMIEVLKTDLAKVERQMDITRSQLYQLIGVQGYLKGKIAELEKPVEAKQT